MLECDICKYRVGNKLHTMMYQPNPHIRIVEGGELICKSYGNREAEWIDDSNQCLFFKPHCGKCGGGCANR